MNMENIKSGDILVTTNGDFQIIQIQCGIKNTEEFIGWCAMFIDDEEGDDKYPLEIQYIVSGNHLQKLIGWIEMDSKISEVKKMIIE